MTEQLIKIKEEINKTRKRFIAGKKFKAFNDGVAEAKLAYDMRIILKGIVKRLSDKLKAMDVQEARAEIKSMYEVFKEGGEGSGRYPKGSGKANEEKGRDVGNGVITDIKYTSDMTIKDLTVDGSEGGFWISPDGVITKFPNTDTHAGVAERLGLATKEIDSDFVIDKMLDKGYVRGQVFYNEGSKMVVQAKDDSNIFRIGKIIENSGMSGNLELEFGLNSGEMKFKTISYSNIVAAGIDKAINITESEKEITFMQEAVGKKSNKKGQLTKTEQMLLAKGVLKPSDFQKIAQTLTIRKAEAMSKAAGNVFRITGFPYSYKQLESRFTNIIRDKVFKITTTEITDTISGQLKDALIRGYENGESIKKIADSFDMLETNYKTIARTEINGAVQEAHYTALEETSADMGVEMEKKWSTAADEKVRDNHFKNEEQGWIPMDEPFQNGEMFPLDPVEDLGEFINCRCDLYYRVAEKPAEAAA